MVAIVAGAYFFKNEEPPVDRPAGAITLWYLDGTTLRPVDPAWTVSITGSIPASNSLNFDEFQNPLILDANISITSASFNWDWNRTDLFDIGNASVSKNFEVSKTASVSAFHLVDSSTGNNFVDCDADNQALGFDITTGRFFCGDDDSAAFDATAQDALTWSDGANASNLWTFDLSGTDPTLLFRSTGFTFTSNASVSTNFEAGGFASASQYFGSAFGATGDCNDSGEAIGWDSASGIFSCNASLQPLDSTLTAFAAYNTNGLLTQTAADTFTGRTITGTTNQITVTNGSGVSGDPTLSIPVLFVAPGAASISTNFEVTGYASMSQIFGGAASHSFAGSLEPDANGLHTIGTTAKKWAQAVVNVIRAAVKFVLPARTASNVNEAGALAVNTASSSLNFHDGTAERVIMDKQCFTYAFENPTTTENWGNKRFLDPFTITEVTVLASGSNAVGWNMIHGAFGAITTDLFTNDKSASSSTAPVYTSFADATLTDKEFLQLEIASASSKIENLDITVCGRYDAP